MSDATPKKSNLVTRLFATITVLLVLLILALVLYVNQVQSPQNSAQHDAEVADFLRTGTPDMSTEEQQAIINTIQENGNASLATPEQEAVAANALLGN